MMILHKGKFRKIQAPLLETKEITASSSMFAAA